MNDKKLPEVTDQQRWQTVTFWREHEARLRRRNLVSEEGLGWISMCTQPDCIGYDGMKGQIRPAELGKWDMLEVFKMAGFAFDECLLLVDITESEWAQQERREELRNAGYDPDDPM